jgi:methylenetetrahydrofolate reductase (NADPH)
VKGCRSAGIGVPIIPGIMPITFYGQIKFLRETCAVTIPDKYLADLEKNKDDKEKIMEISVRHILSMCKELKKADVPGLHFYTLNNIEATERILDQLDFS